ncbi:MAG: methyl-accepting chemotaxis protein, partial [Zoogloea sp.]|nr:methyl-accepting chemotaxis protein [Zoogloea sp.]
MFSKLPIRARLWLLIAGALLFWGAASVYSLSRFYAGMMESRRTSTRNLVELAYSVADHYGRLAQEGKMDASAAREAAQADIAALRYDGNNYFSQYDAQYRMVRHPFKPELNGKDQSELKDTKGTRIVVELVEAAKRGKGEFVEYLWPRPGQKEPVAKLAMAKLYAPWGLVITSGVYIDDVETEFLSQALTIGGTIGIGLIVLVLVSWRVARGISLPLERLREAILHVARSGDLRHRAGVKGGGEVEEIAAAFDGLIERLQTILKDALAGMQAMGSATARLVDATGVVERGSVTQAEAAGSSSAAAEQINNSIGKISADIAQVARLAAETSEQSHQGREVVAQAGEEMGEIARHIGATAEAVQ